MTADQTATIDRYVAGLSGRKISGLDINHLAATVGVTWQEVREHVRRSRRPNRRFKGRKK